MPDASYFLGFDGGGTKTECVLADTRGEIVARATAGPSNPLRAGYNRAWFALSEAADAVLSQQKIKASDIRGICAGLGGASREAVVRRVVTFFERGYPNAKVGVTTDLEIAFEAAFGEGEGMILVAGTGSACLGRDANGRMARAGGRGPWFSDEGSAFDIGRRAFGAVMRAEERRGPETALSSRLFAWHQCRDWDSVLERVAKNPDDVFPRTFPLVAQLGDDGDTVCREILSDAASSLAGLARSVANALAWFGRETPVAKAGGVYARSKYFDAAVGTELEKVLAHVRFAPLKISPPEAAVQAAIRLSHAKGNAA